MIPYPEGRRTFDVPRVLLPEEASPGDVFEVRFEKDAEETDRMLSENRRLLNELLGRDD